MRDLPIQTAKNVTHGHGVHREEHTQRAGPSPRWFALLLRSRHEFAVRDALRAAGVPEFLPTKTSESRWSDRTNSITRPLFSGYIFARFDPSFATSVAETRGVIRILSLNCKPCPIPDGEIANLRLAVEASASVSPCAYVAGETCRVERGPFAGVTGVIQRVKDQTTLYIPIEILGRSVSVQIDAADIEARRAA